METARVVLHGNSQSGGMETASDGVETVHGGMETARVVAWKQPEWWRGHSQTGGVNTARVVAWKQPE